MAPCAFMRYIYGPLKSRRLGNSLGVSLSLEKICNFDCIYCQLGPTKLKSVKRKEYLKVEDIITELKDWIKSNPEDLKKLDYITFSGCGEPTLNIRIAQLISEIKRITVVPVAVITNASLLGNAGVRQELKEADLIVPSLDAVTQSAFVKIDRPDSDIGIEGIIAGLIDLRKEFKGKIWLEIMLVAGVNDDLSEISKLKEAADRINPDKIQLNSPVRATAEENVSPVPREKLEKIKEILGDRAEII